MAIEPIYMPKFGMTMTEGIIVQWHKQPGDAIAAGEALVTVQTEKVDTEIEAPVSGVVAEIRYAVDAEAPVGEVIATIRHEP
jgi:pyruvate/2-oxoglutarate dehydrogenase complex dihydrolipoamide acyltransferase (E2) component